MTFLLRVLNLAVLLYGSWLGMLVIHECGHVIAAAFSGGSVEHVEIPLLGFSRTDLLRNPRPLIVAWGGPIGGVLLPLLGWSLVRWFRPRPPRWLTFFTGSCLVANGVYLGVGVFFPVGDAADLLQHGAPRWSLAAFGMVAIVGGLAFWHSMGSLQAQRPAEKPVKS